MSDPNEQSPKPRRLRTVCIRFTPEIIDQLRVESERDGRTISGFVRHLVEKRLPVWRSSATPTVEA